MTAPDKMPDRKRPKKTIPALDAQMAKWKGEVREHVKAYDSKRVENVADSVSINFDEHKIDALLVSALPNIRYLTGFTGSNAMALLTPDSVTLFTDPRYTIQASAECRVARVPAKVVIASKPLWQYAVAGYPAPAFETDRLRAGPPLPGVVPDHHPSPLSRLWAGPRGPDHR